MLCHTSFTYLCNCDTAQSFLSRKNLTSPARLRGTLVTANIASANRLISLLERFDRLLASSLGVSGSGQRLRGHLLLDGLLVTALSEFIDTRVVDLVGPGLIKIDEEDDVVAESGETVEEGHLDGEGEEVVDEGVEELVCHGAAGHVGDGLEAVVDVQTRDLSRMG